ncbi:ABC transporter substrate-binding protein [Vibrio hippocampi]
MVGSVSSVQAEDINSGGTLVVPIINTGFVDNFNPYTTKDTLHGVMFEPLMVFNTMTDETHWRLAKSAQYSDDLKVITLTLRDGLTWSDGSVLNAEDVAYSFELIKKAPAFDLRGIWSGGNLQSVVATNPTTVTFTLAEPDSTFLWNLTSYHIVPKKVWGQVEQLTTFTNPNPIGSGPMTQVSYLKPQQMELCRNPHYYLEGQPHLDCILMRSYNDNSQIQPALIKGEVDWGSNFVADIENTFVKKDPKNHHFWYPANDAIHLYLNTKREPFNDLKVRQALSVALDRELIVDIAAYGYPTVNFNPSGIGEFYHSYIDQDIKARYQDLTQYNQERATELLDQAGVVDRDGDGWRDLSNGEPFEFAIEVVNGWTDWIQVVQMVTEYYQEIGIKAEVKTVDWAVYDANLRQANYDVAINWSKVASNPILTYQEYFLSSRLGKSWHAGHGVQSAEIDTLIDSFGKTSDKSKQREILSKLQQFTAQNLPFVPLYSNPTWYQYNSSKLGGWPSAENPYIQPVFYDGGNRVIILNNLYLKSGK